MRTGLDHLPAQKQRELNHVVQLIFEEFEDAMALAKHQWRKRGRIEKIILYGSYARGGWVDEPHTAKGYKSDFDLLIIVNDKRLIGRVDYWLKLEDRLNRELAITETLKTPVNFIVHTLQEVNDGLAHGRYFFMDVRRDGIALYEFADTELHEPKPKTPQQALTMSREYFGEWLPSGEQSLEIARFAMGKGWNKKAAFALHQATECLYHGILLVVTFYTPHVHNIGFLRTQAERLDRRLIDIWPQDRRFEQAAWQKLKEAYVKSRYSKHYQISDEQLAWLAARVEALGTVVHTICTERLAGLEQEAAREGS